MASSLFSIQCRNFYRGNFKLNIVDMIILLVILVVLGLIIYFSFIKRKGDVCTKCPYKKEDCNCNKKV